MAVHSMLLLCWAVHAHAAKPAWTNTVFTRLEAGLLFIKINLQTRPLIVTKLVNEAAGIVNKTRPLFTLSLEMTRLVNETRLLLVPGVNSDIYRGGGGGGGGGVIALLCLLVSSFFLI